MHKTRLRRVGRGLREGLSAWVHEKAMCHTCRLR